MPKPKSERQTVSRRVQIIEKLNSKGQVLVKELSKLFKVSGVTIRNDLEQMEKQHLLLRARGGAYKIESGVRIDHAISEKHKLHYNQKVKIGKLAASLIKAHNTILVDSGTTTVEILKHLAPKMEVTVITNALNVANVLIGKPEVAVIIPGGTLRKNSLSLVGPLAEKNLHHFYVDKAFLGCDGFDVTKGFYTPNIEEAHLNRIMIENAREVIVVADSSKFGRKSLNLVGTLKSVHMVITDEGITNEQRRKLEKAKVKVMIAK